MLNTFRLGYSTCPNDTFIFNALVHNLIFCNGFKFDPVLEDVETLNKNALYNIYDISKLSFAAIAHVADKYALLKSGAALGYGCGPIIVARKDTKLHEIIKKTVLVPGKLTTANLLLNLFISDYFNTKIETKFIVFDKIMPNIINKNADFGIVIHEGRFTLDNNNLKCLVDLGEWWENKTNLPIPLGGIVIKRDISKNIAGRIESLIKKSIEFAFNNKNIADSYIKKHANEMEKEVIDQHIKLYVNNFSKDLGESGIHAIRKLFEISRQKGLIPECNKPLFACF